MQIASDEETSSAKRTAARSSDLDVAGGGHCFQRTRARATWNRRRFMAPAGWSMTATSQRGNGPVSPEKMTADDVTGEFGPNRTLTTMTGRGHTAMAETTATGTQQTTSGDALVAHFAPRGTAKGERARTRPGGAMQIESATVDGNVVLTAAAAAEGRCCSADPARHCGPCRLRQHRPMAAPDAEPARDRRRAGIDRGQNECFAGIGRRFCAGQCEGDLSWTRRCGRDRSRRKARRSRGKCRCNFGAQGPTHVCRGARELQRSTGVATFKGNARLWQQGKLGCCAP